MPPKYATLDDCFNALYPMLTSPYVRDRCVHKTEAEMNLIDDAWRHAREFYEADLERVEGEKQLADYEQWKTEHPDSVLVYDHKTFLDDISDKFIEHEINIFKKCLTVVYDKIKPTKHIDRSNSTSEWMKNWTDFVERDINAREMGLKLAVKELDTRKGYISDLIGLRETCTLMKETRQKYDVAKKFIDAEEEKEKLLAGDA